MAIFGCMTMEKLFILTKTWCKFNKVGWPWKWGKGCLADIYPPWSMWMGGPKIILKLKNKIKWFLQNINDLNGQI